MKVRYVIKEVVINYNFSNAIQTEPILQYYDEDEGHWVDVQTEIETTYLHKDE